MQKNNTSGTTGVHWQSHNRKWRAKLIFQGKTYKKDFNKIEDAIKYRKRLEEKYYKPILDKYTKEIDK